MHKSLVHREPAVIRTMKKWSGETEEGLTDCFDTTVWEELCDPYLEDSLTHRITNYINFLHGKQCTHQDFTVLPQQQSMDQT